jgi:hypothetical protein
MVRGRSYLARLRFGRGFALITDRLTFHKMTAGKSQIVKGGKGAGRRPFIPQGKPAVRNSRQPRWREEWGIRGMKGLTSER